MDSKRKMIIAISSCAVVILAAIVAVVAVLAAQNVTIQNSINVSYSADKIIGTVTAKYQVKGSTANNIGDGTWTFTGFETGPDANPTASVDNIQLSETNNYVDFIFTFTNEGTAAYTATLTLPSSSKVKNLKVYYEVVPDGATPDKLSFSVAAGANATYKIRYTIDNADLDAKLDNGSFSWSLA